MTDVIKRLAYEVSLARMTSDAYRDDGATFGRSVVAEDWDTFSKRASVMVADLLRQAADIGYDAGLIAGRDAAAVMLRDKVAKALEMGVSVGAENVLSTFRAGAADLVEAADNSARAALGSVKPAITKAVMTNPNGLTTEEVRRLTGAKANTVRGTLWTLSTTEGLIERKNGKWYPTTKTNEAADDKSPAAPISQQVSPLGAGSHQSDPVKGQEGQVVRDNIEWN